MYDRSRFCPWRLCGPHHRSREWAAPALNGAGHRLGSAGSELRSCSFTTFIACRWSIISRNAGKLLSHIAPRNASAALTTCDSAQNTSIAVAIVTNQNRVLMAQRIRGPWLTARYGPCGPGDCTAPVPRFDDRIAAAAISIDDASVAKGLRAIVTQHERIARAEVQIIDAVAVAGALDLVTEEAKLVRATAAIHLVAATAAIEDVVEAPVAYNIVAAAKVNDRPLAVASGPEIIGGAPAAHVSLDGHISGGTPARASIAPAFVPHFTGVEVRSLWDVTGAFKLALPTPLCCTVQIKQAGAHLPQCVPL